MEGEEGEAKIVSGEMCSVLGRQVGGRGEYVGGRHGCKIVDCPRR